MNLEDKNKRTLITLAIVSGVLLAAFLWLRPYFADFGKPTPPDTSGRADRPVADGVTGSTSGATPQSTPVPSGTPDVSGITHSEELEKLILDLTNKEREKQHLSALREEDTLRDTARAQSDDMIARGFFDHINPDGLSPGDRVAIRHRRLVGLVGENIWRSSGLSPADLNRMANEIMYGEKGWMNSPEHKANILKPDYTNLGVGVSIKGTEVRVSQNFANIRALTNHSVPPEVKNGEVLDLSSSTTDSSAPAERYDYWVSNRGINTGATYTLSDGAVKVEPGVYKLRFYFPRPGGYSIYEGPQIEVK